MKSKILRIGAIAAGVVISSLLAGCYLKSPSSPLTLSLASLKQVGSIIGLYADKHNGRFPRYLDELSHFTMNDEGIGPVDVQTLRFLDPDSRRPYDWLYFPGYNRNSPANIIIAASPASYAGPGRPEERLALFADLSAKRITDDDFRGRIYQQLGTLK